MDVFDTHLVLFKSQNSIYCQPARRRHDRPQTLHRQPPSFNMVPRSPTTLLGRFESFQHNSKIAHSKTCNTLTVDTILKSKPPANRVFCSQILQCVAVLRFRCIPSNSPTLTNTNTMIFAHSHISTLATHNTFKFAHSTMTAHNTLKHA